MNEKRFSDNGEKVPYANLELYAQLAPLIANFTDAIGLRASSSGNHAMTIADLQIILNDIQQNPPASLINAVADSIGDIIDESFEIDKLDPMFATIMGRIQQQIIPFSTNFIPQNGEIMQPILGGIHKAFYIMTGDEYYEKTLEKFIAAKAKARVAPQQLSKRHPRNHTLPMPLSMSHQINRILLRICAHMADLETRYQWFLRQIEGQWQLFAPLPSHDGDNSFEDNSLAPDFNEIFPKASFALMLRNIYLPLFKTTASPELLKQLVADHGQEDLSNLVNFARSLKGFTPN